MNEDIKYSRATNESNVATASSVYFDDVSVRHWQTTQALQVAQVSEYYPFGLAINPLAYNRNAVNKNDYLYNGKELQDDFGLGWMDYGARMYQPELGRWMAVDPLASKYYSISPYTYVANIPTRLIDPNGMEIDWDVDNKKEKRELKKTVREMKRSSETFRKEWKQLKKSESVYTIHASKGHDKAMAVMGGGDPGQGRFDGKYGERADPNSDLASLGDVTPNGTGGDIMINTEVIGNNQGNILEQTLGEEITHAMQYDNVVGGDPNKAFNDNMPGLLDQEFEAKTITGMILQESNMYRSSNISDIEATPIRYGAGLSSGTQNIGSYSTRYGLWRGALDMYGGYGGISTDTPGAVTNSDPKLLKKLIK